MKDRITLFLAKEGITPAEFADKIGVQRSSVSHVLNGRNYPSASFIQKMLGAYKRLNARWLLQGEGDIFESSSNSGVVRTLFSDSMAVTAPTEPIKSPVNPPVSDISDKGKPIEINTIPNISNGDALLSGDMHNHLSKEPALNALPDLSCLAEKEVERIVLFYKDKTFATYTPSK